MTEIFRLKHVPADCEFGIQRNSVRYAASIPKQGLTEETGLLMFIPGYGGTPFDAYTQKLLPYLADKYDCVCLCVEHFDIAAKNSTLRPAQDFFVKLNEIYGASVLAPQGWTLDQVVYSLMDAMRENGIHSLDPACKFQAVSPLYMSFGLMPALDCLQAIFEAAKKFGINKKRVFLLGTSYGGYVAMMMARFAPNTFAMIVDNSGFTTPEEDLNSILGWGAKTINGVKVGCRLINHFTLEPGQENTLLSSHIKMRNLLDHNSRWERCNSKIYSYHFVHDEVAKTKNKIDFARTFGMDVDIELKVLDRDDLDGVIFKTPIHGMEASMRGIFDLSYAKYMRGPTSQAGGMECDEATSITFPCGDHSYTFSITDGRVSLTRTPTPM